MNLEQRRIAIEEELGEPITLDHLTATWMIFQRKKGHRHSTDDLLTGWYALETIQNRLNGANGTNVPDRILDLGTGIGTVGLLVLSCLPPNAKLTCIEAQDVSYRFLLENINANDVGSRVDPLHGDLRELALGTRFPLVTGSPPYFDTSAGIVPSDSQKAHARFELRGDVRDYVRIAKTHLEDDGLFVFCFPWQQRVRAIDAATNGGFDVTVRDVIPRETLQPLFSLFACKTSASVPPIVREEDAFVVRHEDGAHTPSMHAVRKRFGW